MRSSIPEEAAQSSGKSISHPVDIGSPILEIVIDVILTLVRKTIEQDAAAALVQAINGYVNTLYDGPFFMRSR